MSELRGRPIVFGEVLFDRFEDGTAVLGGAPFNVAWHLQGLGLAPLFVSRVGGDELGDRVLEAMDGWGLDTAGLQRDAEQPTGTVEVTLRDGQPSYEIVTDRAYDFIEADAALEAVRGVEGGLLYHGSLAARNEVSAHALARLRDTFGLPVFMDVNLRAPWWSFTQVALLVEFARWVKLNGDELQSLIERDGPSTRTLREAAVETRTRLGLDLLVMTFGERGACFVGPENLQCASPPPLEDVVDTVGAGDAFSAVTVLGLARGWSHETTLARALRFAAEICRRRGATVHDEALYRDMLREWGE